MNEEGDSGEWEAAPTDPVLCAAIPGWFAPPIGIEALRELYGEISVAGGNVITSGWEDANMIMAHADWMPARRLYINRRVWPIFQASIEACLSIGDGYRIRTLGCFAPRPKRVNGDLSAHSWGIAIDINADENPLSLDGVLRKDIPNAWIDEFTKRGFMWGGAFPKPDAMHFQYVRGY